MTPLPFRIAVITATLVACSTPALSATLPEHGIVSGAADYSWDLDNIPDWKLNSLQSTTASDQLASISSPPSLISFADDYSTSARTSLSNNHAFSQIQNVTFPTAGVASFSGWYDQVTIKGGSGTGVAYFTTQIEWKANVGLYAGFAIQDLVASTINPALAPALDFFPAAWDLDETAVTEIYDYVIALSPYDDTTRLFTNPLIAPSETPDLVLTRSSNGSTFLTTIGGSLTFTYGEPFYLVGSLGTVLSDVLSCVGTECAPATDRDGFGTTTIDLANSVHLIEIAIPQGAIASFASGANYNVTAVPEPGTWLMLLAGLGLVAGAVRHRV